jgi:hypothetical protein
LQLHSTSLQLHTVSHDTVLPYFLAGESFGGGGSFQDEEVGRFKMRRWVVSR